MKYLIEKDYDDIELNIVLERLKRNRYLHDFVIVQDIEEGKDYKDYVPIGRIPFVNKYFKTQFGIEQQNPIEIPKMLRTTDFLKRNYKIVKGSNLPRKGTYFIKNVSVLKNFTYDGNLEYFLFDDMFEPKTSEFDTTLRINSEHLFQVSEHVDIRSEWRVYIVMGKIVNISNYDGDTTLFPDMEFIKKVDSMYRTQEDYPKSYSFDVMVTTRGTALIEVHTFSSLGLYNTLWGDDLLYAYSDAKEYVLNYNTQVTEFKVTYE